MIISRSKVTIFFGWIGIFLLPIHDLFNYLFAGTPLVIWKQLLGATLLTALIHWTIFSKNLRKAETKIRSTSTIYILGGIWLTFSSLIMGLSLDRVFYGFLSYAGMLGYLLFSLLIAPHRTRYRLYKFSASLGIACMVGIIIDYYSDFFEFLPRSSGITEDYLQEHGIYKRAAFLFGASTTVLPFASFSLISIAIICANNRGILSFALLNLAGFLFMFSMYLTGSRAGLYLMLTCYLFSLWAATDGLRASTRWISAFLFIATFSAIGFSNVNFADFLGNTDRFASAFSAQDEGNSNRFMRWSQGLDLMLTPRAEWVVGNGLGSTIGGFNDGIETSTHFESSVFQGFYEGGILLLIYRYLATFVAYSSFIRGFRQRTTETSVLAIWIALHFFATATSPTFGAYHTQMVYFIACGLLTILSTPSSRKISGSDAPSHKYYMVEKS